MLLLQTHVTQEVLAVLGKPICLCKHRRAPGVLCCTAGENLLNSGQHRMTVIDREHITHWNGRSIFFSNGGGFMVMEASADLGPSFVGIFLPDSERKGSVHF